MVHTRFFLKSYAKSPLKGSQEILSQLSLFYPKNTARKLEGKESQVQPKNCLDFEFGS